MREITPLDLPDLVPADLSGVAQPDFDLVDPRDLLVDETYQRDLVAKSIALIRRVVEEWRWSKFKPPICVRVDGKLHVIDGQHTAIAAATHPGITIIPVIVVDEPRAVDRAKAFVSHARDRLVVTPGQVWRAEVAAGVAEAVTIQRICEVAGVKLLPFSPSRSAFTTGETVALVAIKGVVARRGAEQAGDILRALAKADLAPISGDMIKAAEALLCEAEYKVDFDPDRIAASIRALGPRAQREAKELAAAKCLPMWRALVAVIFRNRKGKPPASISDVGNKPMPAAPSPRRPTVRPPEPALYSPGDPPPGRSALDQTRAHT